MLSINNIFKGVVIVSVLAGKSFLFTHFHLFLLSYIYLDSNFFDRKELMFHKYFFFFIYRNIWPSNKWSIQRCHRIFSPSILSSPTRTFAVLQISQVPCNLIEILKNKEVYRLGFSSLEWDERTSSSFWHENDIKNASE